MSFPLHTITNIALSTQHTKPIFADLVYRVDNTPKPVIIFAHGFKGFKDWGAWQQVAECFAAAGLVVVRFNFSHNGTTLQQPDAFADLVAFGNNNFILELDDLQTVINWVNSNYFPVLAPNADPSRLGLWGHSRGGGICILKAAEDSRIKALATWASVASFADYWTNSTWIDQWERTGEIMIPNVRTGQLLPIYKQMYDSCLQYQQRLDIPAAAAALRCPFLAIHGTADNAVPFEAANILQQAQPKMQLLTVPNASHTFGIKHPWQNEELPEHTTLATEATIAFFRQTLQYNPPIPQNHYDI